jgi:uncharacterized 2Fe-2S/4Fe-4S cluster protein (DUF4445 family)
MADPPCHLGVRLEGERDEAVRHLSFEPGPSLRDVLSHSSVPVRSACAGIGACGLCRVRIDEGDGGPATAAELLHLGEAAVAARTRLACQVTPAGDMDVTVLEPARPSSWRTPHLPPYRAAYPPLRGRAPAGAPSGVAVDLGTTHITVASCDVTTGGRLAARTAPNPQGRFGADVVARLDAAARSDAAARELRRLVVEAIGEGLLELSRSEGLVLPEVGCVRVVANSAMLTLLAAVRPATLLDPARWTAPVECLLSDRAAVAEAWNLSPSVAIDLVQPLGGFVGSDLAAGVVHCRLIETREPALLVDFGTNSEIALWDGERLWATAAAGGPAFEAVGIGCGTGAGPGAIHRLSRRPDGTWSGEVLESGSPRGICGSGLVDLLAFLRAGGEIDERGRPAREPITISVGGAELGVSKADVDALQRAKGAVAAGIEVLCRRASVRLDDLATVWVAGSFGEHLDVESAARIGLLPPIAAERMRLAGNTALHGALDLVLSAQAEAALARARARTTLVNLSMEADFEDLFLEHLHIRPMARRAG